MEWHIILLPSALDDLVPLPIKAQGKIRAEIERLARNPYTVRHITEIHSGPYPLHVGAFTVQTWFEADTRAIVIHHVRPRGSCELGSG